MPFAGGRRPLSNSPSKYAPPCRAYARGGMVVSLTDSFDSFEPDVVTAGPQPVSRRTEFGWSLRPRDWGKACLKI